MQFVLFSTLKTYLPVFRPRPYFSFPLDLIPRNQYNSLSFLADICFAIIDEPIFWLFFFSFFIPFFICCIYILVKFKLEIFFPSKESKFNTDISCDYHLLIHRKLNKESLNSINFNCNCFKIIHILGLLYITTTVCYAITPVRQRMVNFDSFTTLFNIIFSMTHYEKKLNENIDLLNISRRFLPKDRYWLDNRDDPIYPLVHGDINAYCAYNKKDKKCQTLKKTKEQKVPKIRKMPNVYFLIIESFTPFSYLINEEFIEEHSMLNSSDEKFFVTDTPYYNKKVLPNLAKFAKEGIVFSGLSSSGLPTLSGMHSLFTGVPPSQSIMNVIDSSDAHVDDFPSHFHDIDDFRTFFGSPTDFTYDGLHFWLNRRSDKEEAKIRLHCNDSSDLFDDPIQKKLMPKNITLKNCTEKEIDQLIHNKKIKSFPKWFDYLVGFFPNQEQLKILNISEPVLKKSEWVADRVLSKELEFTWKMQKEFLKRKNADKPILGVSINMETHIPYFGFDNNDQYEKIDKSFRHLSNKHKKQRFIRANKYTDEHYIKEMINFLKKEDNNTIVVVLGDHGTRDIPVRNRKKIKITRNTELSGNCIEKPSGIDSLFITSGAMFYLGDDENVKKELKLDFLKGKTVKVSTDHNDMVYTIMEIISRLQNKPLPPTHRLGRNLIDLSEDIIKTIKNDSNGTSKVVQKLNDMDWQSISYISHQLEYKRGAKFLRTHSAGPNHAHYYDVASFPTCVKRVGERDEKFGGKEARKMFDEMSDYLNVNNYLLFHNRIFNYGFRNESCIKNGSCNFPPKEDKIYISDRKFFAVLLGVPLFVGFVCQFLILGVRKIYFPSIENSPNNETTNPDI